MANILRHKLIRLVRGEEGVALVVTLALFMFLYVSCAGVYTVGKAVKERILLQNAVDAAAYSAAVVQADCLSRIATINKAMAWNYAQFLKAQKNWIALRFLQKINESPTKTFNTPINVTGATKNPWKVDDDVRPRLSADINEYEKAIESYYDKIVEQRSELLKLKKELEGDDGEKRIYNRVNEVLKSNLPFKIGELCRFRIKIPAVNETVEVMQGTKENENEFLDMTEDSEVADLIESPWFEVDTASTGFARGIATSDKLKANEWSTSSDGIHWSVRHSEDAYDFVAETPEYLNRIEPLTLVSEYFPGGNASKGAITVAVAKKNENPWLGLVGDVTGIHAAFNYAENNEWTFAVASAQAGYRNNKDQDQSDENVREYSLNGSQNEFDYVSLGKKGGYNSKEYSGQDWDAVHLPVRKAFDGSAVFASWLKDNSGAETWEYVVDAGRRKYVTTFLDEIRFEELNNRALSRMHNTSGSEHVLDWAADEFLDLMFH